jgi:hypothetical protein
MSQKEVMAAEFESLRAQVQELKDKSDIAEVMYRYALALDTKAYDGLDEVFVEDARMMHVSPESADDIAISGKPMEGREEIKRVCSSILNGLTATQHFTGHPIIEIRGDSATSKAYLHEQHYHSGDAGEETLETGGVYTDRWIRTSEGWRIVERQLKPIYWYGDMALLDRAMARASSTSNA